VYQVTFSDGVWKIWRNAPELNRRFIGKLAPGGRTTTGQWSWTLTAQAGRKTSSWSYRKVK
jgi:hypothetical protein